MAERSHLSIGEVLSLLREEFPDVTISKIRFLESQGLVDPERTPSGYRKFYEYDVDRLRWILQQQREHFLPLKVIKDRLLGAPEGTAEDQLLDLTDYHAYESEQLEAAAVAAGHPEREAKAGAVDPAGQVHGSHFATRGERAGETGAVEKEAPSSGSGDGDGASGSDPDALGTKPSKAAADKKASRSTGKSARTRTSRQSGSGEGNEMEDTFSVDELAEESGASTALVTELRQYGLIIPVSDAGGAVFFGPEALVVARVAAAFNRHGIEARHLRPWRNAADREVGVFEQLVVPLLRQRNPEAREQAKKTLEELADLGAQLRAALVRSGLERIH